MLAERPRTDLVAHPAAGRSYTSRRSVRLGDASPAGRLRLDAVARYLQDVSNDDTLDAGLSDAMAWVVRRAVVEVVQAPVFNEKLSLTTFCSGIGARWAERRVVVVGDQGGQVQAAIVWVHVDDRSGRPRELGVDFRRLYAEASGGREVRPKLQHRSSPSEGEKTVVRPWPLRFVDFDLLGHMNNAAYWAAVEDELARRRDLRGHLRAEVEYRIAVEPGAHVELVTAEHDDGVELWLRSPAGTHASAVVHLL